MQNTNYWHNEGLQKVFTHPIYEEWIADLDRAASVLDLGCGYGRLTPELQRTGFGTIVGYDFSGPLIARAVRENPGATYTNRFEDVTGKSFDLILCFALFTSCPAPDEQGALVARINAVTQAGARLYISDYETRDNPSYRARYEQRKLDLYGCFSSESAVFRHHTQGHFDRLFGNWEKHRERSLRSETLNGNAITIHQYLYTKRRSPVA